MGFPASDFDECAPMVWGHGDDDAACRTVVSWLYRRVAEPAQWRLDILAAQTAVSQALRRAEHAARPVVIADTQDNPGAGGDSNTTGLLHALLAQGAGQRYPGQVALGLKFGAAAAAAAHAAGLGAEIEIEIALGKAVPTFSGQPSDVPVRGRFKVQALSDGACTLTGPMMTGLTAQLGASACLEIEVIQVAVVSGKKQLLDRQTLRLVGIQPEAMRVIVVKSSNHFRADFGPIASQILVAKAAGPMAACTAFSTAGATTQMVGSPTPPQQARLRASASLPLAAPSASRRTRAGTRAGAATLKPTLPAAPTKPSTASRPIGWPVRVASSSPASDRARRVSAAAISRRRETRSASRPSGIASSRKGRLWAVLSRPIWPGPACSSSTATMGTAARLTCSAACAARLAPARRWTTGGRG